jgi:hypothetical protein
MLAILILELLVPFHTLAGEAPCRSSNLAAVWVQNKKPTPTPTPPPDGPNLGDIGGPHELGIKLSGIVSVGISAQKKPTPTPTPPPDGPDPGDIGGPGRIVGDPAMIQYDDIYKRSRRASPSGRRAGGLFDYLGRIPSRDLNRAVPCDPEDHEAEDFSGTYSGNIEYPNGNLSGFATLQIDGREFTVLMKGHQLKGTLAAETTCNYTAVAMRFESGAEPSPATSFPTTLSLQAKKSGADLRLTSVPGEKEFSFIPNSSKPKKPNNKRD